MLFLISRATRLSQSHDQVGKRREAFEGPIIDVPSRKEQLLSRGGCEACDQGDPLH